MLLATEPLATSQAAPQITIYPERLFFPQLEFVSALPFPLITFGAPIE